MGETSITNDQVCFEQIARRVCKEVGFRSAEDGLDCFDCNVITNITS